MSYKTLSLAWETNLPCTAKLLLISLADQSNDSGVCWPSIRHLSARTGLSERSVYRHLSELEELGHISRDTRGGRSTIYTVHPCHCVTPDKTDTPDTVSPTPDTVSPTPDTVSPRTIKEPPSNQNTLPNGNESPTSVDSPMNGKKQCPHQEIINLYHEKLTACPTIREWNATRKAYLRSRWNEKEDRQDLHWWDRFFDYVGKSDFLMGRTDGRDGKPPFIADLEWMIRPTNFVKIIEGKYHR